jgi:hypothetical protein
MNIKNDGRKRSFIERHSHQYGGYYFLLLNHSHFYDVKKIVGVAQAEQFDPMPEFDGQSVV